MFYFIGPGGVNHELDPPEPQQIHDVNPSR
jgi:hypothetical protein